MIKISPQSNVKIALQQCSCNSFIWYLTKFKILTRKSIFSNETCVLYIGEALSDIPISDRFVELLKFPNTHDLILVFIESIEHTRRFCVIQLELILQKVYGVRLL